MEGDDGAVAGVFVNLAQYLTAILLGIVVARHEVPHDDAVALAQCAVLPEAHDAVRRTEKVGGEVAVGLVDIGDVSLGALLESLEVVEGMVTYTVTTLNNHLVLIWMLAYIVAYHKESSLDLVFVQHIKYPRRYLGDRTIVEGEIDSLLRCIHPPMCTGVQSADELWGLLNEHMVSFEE